jgi:hypothetical protein
MKDLDIFKVKMHMLDVGIVPAFTGKQLKEMLESLPAKDRRVAKRKFRKEWRKLLKRNPGISEMLTSGAGSEPTSNQIRHRSIYVLQDIIRKVSVTDKG